MKLVVIEGLDGAGKSTQISLLKEFLKGRSIDFRYIHFPRTDAPFYGELIARFLRGEFGTAATVDPWLVAMLYAGDRNDAATQLKGWLSEGKLVLLDRYTYSNIAYQCAKLHDKKERAKLRNWILDLEFRHFGIPAPDLNIFLDVPFSFTERKLSGSRSGDDRNYLNGSADIHEADIEFQRNVRNVYLETAGRDDRLTVIKCSDENDEMKAPGEIFEMVRELLYSHNILD